MTVRPVYSTVPAKTYASVDRAVRALVDACKALGIADMQYLVAADGARFFPVALPNASQVQDGVNLAMAKSILVVRT